jgi:hypothetical protein
VSATTEDGGTTRGPDPYWPIIFATMRKAAETGSKDLADDAARLIAGRNAADRATLDYEATLTNIGCKVGMRDAVRAHFTDDDDRPAPSPTTPPGGSANDDAPAAPPAPRAPAAPAPEAEAPPASEPRPIPLARFARLDAATLDIVDRMAGERNVTREELLLAAAKRGLGILEAGLSEEEWAALRAEMFGERPEDTTPPPANDRNPPSGRR